MNENTNQKKKKEEPKSKNNDKGEDDLSPNDSAEASDVDNDKDGDKLIKYSVGFLSTGDTSYMVYIKPVIKLMLIGLFWSSMLQMALPKMGGM
jgi:hypothetical protein